jgi:hypothetical protein
VAWCITPRHFFALYSTEGNKGGSIAPLIVEQVIVNFGNQEENGTIVTGTLLFPPTFHNSP